jgi:hypothetical protein
VHQVVILARESGLNISMEDVPVQSLVPPELVDCSIDEFMQRLPEFDQQVAIQPNHLRTSASVNLLFLCCIAAGCKPAMTENKNKPTPNKSKTK